MATSSADPSKLDEYVLAHMAWVDDMRLKIQTFVDEVDFYNNSSAVTPKINPDLAANLQDHIERWAHLGEFVADVSRGFHELIAQREGELQRGFIGPVFTFNDDSIGRAGQVGFADRQEAERQAREAAEALQEAVESGHGPPDNPLSQEELAEIIADISEGQYDPAFAVEFSHQLGVAGYVDATSAIGQVYYGEVEEGDWGVLPDGHAAVQILGSTLTTAMHASGHPPLSEGFKQDLLEYTPPENPDRESWPPASHRDLAALMSYTDPPMLLASELATRHMSAVLAGGGPGAGDGGDWGPRGSALYGYGEMLSRNPDASAHWLSQDYGNEGTNLELALSYDYGYADPPYGESLAQVVENGLTHRDGMIRRVLMDQSIETVADLDEITNPYMPEALAAGVDENMGLIDDRINEGWDDPNLDGAPTEDAEETFDFFKNVTRDAEAADQVAVAAEHYVMDRIDQLPPVGSADPIEAHQRNVGLVEIGHVRGVIMGAEGEALIDDTVEYIERQQQRAEMVNFTVGLIPYYPQMQPLTEVAAAVNGIGEIGGISVGDAAFPSDMDDLVEEIDADDLRLANALGDSALLIYGSAHPEALATPLREMTDEQRRALIDQARASFDMTDPATLEMREDQMVLFGATDLAARHFAGND